MDKSTNFSNTGNAGIRNNSQLSGNHTSGIESQEKISWAHRQVRRIKEKVGSFLGITGWSGGKAHTQNRQDAQKVYKSGNDTGFQQTFQQGIFKEKQSATGFEQGIPGAKYTEAKQAGSKSSGTKHTGYKASDHTSRASNNANGTNKENGHAFKEQGFIKKETVNPNANIAVSSLLPTLFKTKKTERLTYSAKSPIFDTRGVYRETLSKGTSILTDTSKPIFELTNPKTKRKEAYLAISGYIYKNAKNEEFVTTAPGYIRASWLDSRINQSSNPSKEQKQEHTTPGISESRKSQSTQKQSKVVRFDGYMGPDGRVIPPYIVQAVTVNYLKKDVLPKVKENLEELQGAIIQTRGKITEEVIRKGVPISDTQGFKEQKEKIEKKGRVENFYQSLQSFTINGTPVVTDPNVAQVIASIQSTPKWQKILQQAAYIDYQKRAGKIK